MATRTAIPLALPAALALIVTIAGMPDAVAVSRPSAPRSVHSKPGNGTVRVTWVPPLSDGGSPVNGYAVQRSAASTGPWSTVASPAATTFAWKNTGLVNGTRYYYRVKAHNVAGWSGGSKVVSAVPRTVPSAPQSLATSWSDASVTLSWSAPASDGGAAINEYQVQYTFDTNGTWTNASAGTQTQLTVTGIGGGNGYYFRVRAHNAAGWGPTSEEAYATPGVPQIPVDFQAQSSAGGIAISCSDWETGITWFDVQASTNGDLWSDLPSYPGGPTAHSFSDTYTGGVLGQTYFFRFAVENRNGPSPWSSAVSAVFGLAPGGVGNLTATHYGSPLFANAVSWSAPATGSPVQGYYVDRIVNAPPYQRVATKDAAHTSYYDQGIAAGNDYWYRVTPYNQLGLGPSTLVEVVT